MWEKFLQALKGLGIIPADKQGDFDKLVEQFKDVPPGDDPKKEKPPIPKTGNAEIDAAVAQMVESNRQLSAQNQQQQAALNEALTAIKELKARSDTSAQAQAAQEKAAKDKAFTELVEQAITKRQIAPAKKDDLVKQFTLADGTPDVEGLTRALSLIPENVAPAGSAGKTGEQKPGDKPAGAANPAIDGYDDAARLMSTALRPDFAKGLTPASE